MQFCDNVNVQLVHYTSSFSRFPEWIANNKLSTLNQKKNRNEIRAPFSLYFVWSSACCLLTIEKDFTKAYTHLLRLGCFLVLFFSYFFSSSLSLSLAFFLVPQRMQYTFWPLDTCTATTNKPTNEWMNEWMVWVERVTVTA